MSFINKLIRDIKYDMSKNPIKLAWKLIFVLPIYFTLFLLCLLIALSEMRLKAFFEVWNDIT